METVKYNTTMYGNATMECDANDYENICLSNDCFEGIPNNGLIKLYLDIDYWKLLTDAEEYVEEFTKAFIDIAKNVIDSIIDIQYPDVIPEYCISTASSPNFTDCKTKELKWKISIHIVIPNIVTTRENMRLFVIKANAVAKENKQYFYGDYVYDMETFFDESVYKPNQKLRSLHASKSGENRPLILIEGCFNDSIVSAFIPSDALQLPSFCESKPVTIEPIKTLQEQSKNNDHKFIKMALDNGLFKNLCEDYCKWFNFGCCVKNALGDDGYELFNLFSKLSSKYDEHCVKSQWDNIKIGTSDNKKKLTIASIHKWAKDENPTVYKMINGALRQKIEKPQKVLIKTLDYDIAILFAEYCKSINKTFYCLNMTCNEWCFITDELIWELDGSNKGSSIYNLISTAFYNYRFKFRADIINECKAENINLENTCQANMTSEQKLKCLNISRLTSELEYLKTNSNKNAMFNELKTIVNAPLFMKDINVKLYDVPLKNKLMLDAKTLYIRDRNVTDKFSYYCNAEYIPMEIGDVKYKAVDDYFLGLFCGDVNIKNLFVNVLKTSIAGIRLKNIFFCTGEKGNNGKSTLFAILKHILGLCIDTISKKVIIESGTQSQTHNTELEKLPKIRIGYVAEVCEEDCLNIPIIKQIIGGDPMNVRALHKSDVTIQPTCNLFILTNEMPDYKSNDIIAKRIVIFPFNNEFENDNMFQGIMFEKADEILTYIMKYGEIISDVVLTNEMVNIKTEYIETTIKDYLGEFISEKYELKCEAKVDVDAFYKRFIVLCKDMNYKSGVNTKAKLTKLMKKKGFECKPTNGKRYYYGLDFKEIEEVDNDYN